MAVEPATDDSRPERLVALDEIEAARERLRDVVRPTRVGHSHSLSRLAGRPVLLKFENAQRTGSFKIRGAYHHIARTLDQEGEGAAEAIRRAGVVAASAGNHAQGVALAASLLGVRATIFMPVNAALPKVDATRNYGGEIRLVGTVVDETLAAAQEYAAAEGAHYVAPFDDRDVIAGQGTLGLELLEQAPDLDTVVVPIGGGGLIAGVAAAIKAVRPRVRVVGVEPDGAACMATALVTGEPTPLASVETMADGVAVRSVSALTLAHARAFVDDVVTVSEEQISQALLLLLERAKAVVEPSGATALAAVLAGKVGGHADAPTCPVLSGGNVDPLVLTRVMQHGLTAAGRFLMLRVLLPDRPGELGALLGRLAERGLNVTDIEHHREAADLSIDEVEVRLILETRDPDHRDQVVQDLRSAGYRVERL